MKILFLNTHPNIRGPLPKIFPIVTAALRELGCEVVTRPWGQQRASETLLTKLLRGTKDLIAIGKCLAAAPVDVLFINTAHDARSFARDIPLLLATRLLGSHKTAILFHGSQAERLIDVRARLFRFATAWMVRRCDAVFLLSTEEVKAWRTFYPHTQYHVVRLPQVSGAEGAACDPGTQSSSQDLPLLLFVGRTIKPKGVLDLVESLPTVLSRVRCRVMIAGDGVDRPLAERRVHELGLGEAVVFAGYLRDAELRQAYRAASVFVLPTYFPEGFPVVVLEAMAAGLPIITTRTRGVADWLTDPTNALFVPAQDPHVLAVRIIELLSNRHLMDSMRAANRELVASFQPHEIAREWLRALVTTTEAN